MPTGYLAEEAAVAEWLTRVKGQRGAEDPAELDSLVIIGKVHAEDTGEERERQEDGRHERQRGVNLLHTQLGHHRQVLAHLLRRHETTTRARRHTTPRETHA